MLWLTSLSWKEKSMKWWETEAYTDDTPVAPELFYWAGPNGVAMVRAFDNGKTDAGWSKDRFVTNYTNGKFANPGMLAGFVQDRWALAVVMRSVSVICIDIDGKNGGLTNVVKLGMLPRTLAETSKSGNGYHLFYGVADIWHSDFGFAKFGDRVSLVEGVDIRGVGCVYHHKNQRWNTRKIEMLPSHMESLLLSHEAASTTYEQIEELLVSGDEWEIAVMRQELIDALAKNILPGRRNTTLFAIGSKMAAAGVPDWQAMVEARSMQVGLDNAETATLLRNIQKYGVKA